jgi:hypothetical protein
MPAMMYEQVEAPVAKMIIYMPDAEATFGGTPILNKRGLKIEPPPRPNAPEAKPPKIEPSTSVVKLEPFSSISPGSRPLPYLILISCSQLTYRTAYHITKRQIIM